MMHLTLEQRYTISVSVQQKMSVKDIANLIGKDRSVIYRELSRNRSPGAKYDHLHAQKLCDEKKATKPHFIRFTDPIKEYVHKCLLLDFSPEQIVGKAHREGIDCVSITTIYHYVRRNKEDPHIRGSDKLYTHLRLMRNRHDKQSAKDRRMGVIPDRTMIDERPQEINNRSRIGDFEADTMWISGKACIVTVVERKSGLLFMRAMADRKSSTLIEAMNDIFKGYIGELHSITVDNGKEFYRHKELSAALGGVKIYFAHPYCSAERGTNENTNGLLRQYLPRKTEFTSLSAPLMELIKNKLNSRPRKRLGFMSPIEYFNANFKN